MKTFSQLEVCQIWRRLEVSSETNLRKVDIVRKILMSTTVALALTSAAWAGGSHTGGHSDGHEGSHGHVEEMAVGQPGERKRVTRVVHVELKETDDGMTIEPGSLVVKKGETILFSIKNTGEIEHEFVLDTLEKNHEHKELMAKFPEMEHDDPNSVRLDSGEQAEIVWSFTNAGKFEFACLIPGHYESGMHGEITVKKNIRPSS
ncbi:putative cupredoxin-like copper-binding protein [Labrenzia sp. MBR-25]|jgi:uncharacterized cupredoxin-like copper-binding protein